MSHELVVTIRQTTKIGNVFANNILINIKLSEAQISKIIQSVEFLGSWLNRLGRKVITGLAIPFTRDKFPGLVSNITSNAINKFEKTIVGKEL